MNRGLQIVLLIVLFAISTGAGFFISKMVFGDKDEEQVVPSTKDDSKVAAITETQPIWGTYKVEPQTDGNYKITIPAYVEGADASNLLYILYSDAECTIEYARNSEGVFEVASTSSGYYYAVAINNDKQSEMLTISGCLTQKVITSQQPQQPQQVKLTAQDKENREEEYKLKLQDALNNAKKIPSSKVPEDIKKLFNSRSKFYVAPGSNVKNANIANYNEMFNHAANGIDVTVSNLKLDDMGEIIISLTVHMYDPYENI